MLSIGMHSEVQAREIGTSYDIHVIRSTPIICLSLFPLKGMIFYDPARNEIFYF